MLLQVCAVLRRLAAAAKAVTQEATAAEGDSDWYPLE